jgi:hypothetical protein
MYSVPARLIIGILRRTAKHDAKQTSVLLLRRKFLSMDLSRCCNMACTIIVYVNLIEVP